MTNITTRPASRDDAAGMCRLLNTIIAKGGTTAHSTKFDEARMISHYIETPNGISCTVALKNDDVVGFQWMQPADPNWTGDDKLPEGWAIIASFVADGMQGNGIGGKLFAATRAAALTAEISYVDATIRKYNTGGLAYYSSLGFETYRESESSISKKYTVSASH